MTKQTRSLASDLMTLGNMLENGVRSLFVSCWICHHQTVLSADPWADDIPVPAFGPRMVCTACGIIGADAQPNWRERPERESLTGQTYATLHVWILGKCTLSIPCRGSRPDPRLSRRCLAPCRGKAWPIYRLRCRCERDQGIARASIPKIEECKN
jgi:hypothetical protein